MPHTVHEETATQCALCSFYFKIRMYMEEGKDKNRFYTDAKWSSQWFLESTTGVRFTILIHKKQLFVVLKTDISHVLRTKCRPIVEVHIFKSLHCILLLCMVFCYTTFFMLVHLFHSLRLKYTGPPKRLPLIFKVGEHNLWLSFHLLNWKFLQIIFSTHVL